MRSNAFYSSSKLAKIWIVLFLVCLTSPLFLSGKTVNAQAQVKISKIAWSPNGQQVAVGYSNGRLEIRTITGQLDRTLSGHQYRILALSWHPNGTLLLSGGEEEFFVWNTVSGQITADLNTQYGYSAWINTATWNRDTSQIYAFQSGVSNQELLRWNGSTYQFIGGNNEGDIDGIQWNLTRDRVAIFSSAGATQVYDPMTFSRGAIANELGSSAAAWSPGSQRIASATWYRAIRIWSLPSGGAQSVTIPDLLLNQTIRGDQAGQPRCPDTCILGVAFSLSGNRVYSVSGSGEFAVWNANISNQPSISTTQLPGAPITAATFNAGGTRLAYGDSTGTLRFYDVPAEGANDVIALFNTSTRQANLFNTLANNPPADNTISFATGVPTGATGGQWVMGDWDGDGVETPGVYGPNGVFYHTNALGPSNDWQGTWFGLLTGTAGNRPVAGRFDASLNHDCIGVTDSSDFPPYGTAFALYFTCNLAGGNPPKTFQWLSVLLPNSEGHSGVWEFSAGNFDPTVDAVDTIACRRGNFIAWTNTPPTTPSAAFPYAQYIGAPHSGTSQFVVGDWNSDGTDSFGLYYVTLGRLRGRNDLDWNSGLYPIDQQLDTNIVGTTSISATTWRLR